jgi:hypothetical protein
MLSIELGCDLLNYKSSEAGTFIMKGFILRNFKIM